MRSVVITGGTRGLGLRLAENFRKRGFNIAICGTKESSVEKALTHLRSIQGDGELLGECCNVSDSANVRSFAFHVKEVFGSIDIWINNAGVNQSDKYAWDISSDEVDLLLSIDLKGTINGSQAAVQMMIEQGHGAIYNVEGMGSNDAFQPRLSIYGTAKRAVTYFTDALSKEIADRKLPIIVGKISPGIMITDFLTSSNGQQNTTQLSDKNKKVYNILGDYPDVIASYLVPRIIDNKKNGVRIAWLTGRKAFFRFLTASFSKRNFFKEENASM